jgi:Glycosyl transferase family 2
LILKSGTLNPKQLSIIRILSLLFIDRLEFPTIVDYAMSVNESSISCIIPVYNGERYLREAIDSILTQTYRSLEVIVAVPVSVTIPILSTIIFYGRRSLLSVPKGCSRLQVIMLDDG